MEVLLAHRRRFHRPRPYPSQPAALAGRQLAVQPLGPGVPLPGLDSVRDALMARDHLASGKLWQPPRLTVQARNSAAFEQGAGQQPAGQARRTCGNRTCRSSWHGRTAGRRGASCTSRRALPEGEAALCSWSWPGTCPCSDSIGELWSPSVAFGNTASVALIRGAPLAARSEQLWRGSRGRRRGHARAQLADGDATEETVGAERLLRTRTSCGSERRGNVGTSMNQTVL